MADSLRASVMTGPCAFADDAAAAVDVVIGMTIDADAEVGVGVAVGL